MTRLQGTPEASPTLTYRSRDGEPSTLTIDTNSQWTSLEETLYATDGVFVLAHMRAHNLPPDAKEVSSRVANTWLRTVAGLSPAEADEIAPRPQGRPAAEEPTKEVRFNLAKTLINAIDSSATKLDLNRTQWIQHAAEYALGLANSPGHAFHQTNQVPHSPAGDAAIPADLRIEIYYQPAKPFPRELIGALLTRCDFAATPTKGDTFPPGALGETILYNQLHPVVDRVEHYPRITALSSLSQRTQGIGVVTHIDVDKIPTDEVWNGFNIEGWQVCDFREQRRLKRQDASLPRNELPGVFGEPGEALARAHNVRPYRPGAVTTVQLTESFTKLYLDRQFVANDGRLAHIFTGCDTFGSAFFPEELASHVLDDDPDPALIAYYAPVPTASGRPEVGVITFDKPRQRKQRLQASVRFLDAALIAEALGRDVDDVAPPLGEIHQIAKRTSGFLETLTTASKGLR